MVAWSALLIPIALSVVLVFFSSSVIHMVLKWHNPDYRKLPDEPAVRSALSGIAPGQYIVPHCLDMKEMADPEVAKLFEEGPNGVMWIRANGQMQLGPFLRNWVIYTVLVSALVAYLARATLAPGAEYLSVFQVVGATAWLAYSWQSPADSIWKGKPWICTVRTLFDGLVYALLTAGAFSWLWPAA